MALVDNNDDDGENDGNDAGGWMVVRQLVGSCLHKIQGVGHS